MTKPNFLKKILFAPNGPKMGHWVQKRHVSILLNNDTLNFFRFFLHRFRELEMLKTEIGVLCITKILPYIENVAFFLEIIYRIFQFFYTKRNLSKRRKLLESKSLKKVLVGPKWTKFVQFSAQNPKVCLFLRNVIQDFPDFLQEPKFW